MLNARERIERQMADPSLVRLHRKLSRLKSTVTMMNTGAHPDDEHNGMLAWLRLGLGMRVVIACSTRGEGGQNALGPERLGALGVIRSRELEEAARVLNADVHWLGHGPADPVHDFGFSKNGDATFGHWGEDRIVERLVRAYRMERPDIVVPTFLDVPGQHGHHRAMTRAAETAIALAADPKAHPEHLDIGLKPWRVAKFYLPAWSGGGDTYDDEVPPPDATVIVEAEGRDPATGAEYGRIGEWSRYYHASQGMGRWPKQVKKSWPLHLKLSSKHMSSEQSVLDCLPASLAALARTPGIAAKFAEALGAADRAIEVAVWSFPDTKKVALALLEAAGWLEIAEASANDSFLRAHGHRLARKRREVDAAILDATGIFERAYADPATIVPGGAASLFVELGDGAASRKVDVVPVMPPGISTKLDSVTPTDERAFSLNAASDAPISEVFTPSWSAMGGNGVAHVKVAAQIGERLVTGVFDLEEPFAVAPSNSVNLSPDALIIPLGVTQTEWAISLDVSGEKAAVSFAVPQGWTMKAGEAGWVASLHGAPKPGLVEIEPKINARPAVRATPIAYPHIGRSVFRTPATLKILSLDLKLPEGARVGYVGGGADRVGLWLTRMGLDVTELDAQALAGDLSRFTTIVVGIFTFGLREDLAAARARLHRFVEEGGHLVTLYHRPSDGWDPAATPPRRIEIGSPSVRWRVTDPAAEVTVLEPDHVLLKAPNRIGPEDWQGWEKERGLYFPSRWDDAYTPVLSMHDVDEQPLRGALLSGTIGKGRHSHVSLVLHHQMDRLVPGAFRLMANLVQPA
jgi:LmbE family N-acetylglucosaminyl deacetylase